MGFMDSYKRLEKLCGEVMNDDHRVSAYIDAMTNTPRGAMVVKGWEEDLKQLKHYRWMRNQIAHNPECTEKTMCKPSDAQWVDGFYDRIMKQTDPLAMYRKAMRRKRTNANRKVSASEKASITRYQRKAKQTLYGFVLAIVVMFVLVALVVWMIG